MKVLFTFGGLPHYSNPILSRLNSHEKLEIVVAVPQRDGGTLGNGVFENNENINFKVTYLKEKKAFYGNYYLQGLLKAIQSEKPDVVVLIWPYVLNFVVNRKLRRHVKRNKIKLILKEIPFDTPSYNDSFKYYKSKYSRSLNEDLELRIKVNLPFYIKHFILKKVRKYYYGKLLDASVNYTDEAYLVCPSYGLRKESIFVTTNSPDTDLLFQAAEKIKQEKLLLPDNPYRIIHVGRLVKWKRVDLLIESVARLKEEFPKIELLVIGKGKEEDTLKKLVNNLDLHENVNFIGGVYNNQDLGRYFLASSIYVLAGMGGLSINEAMAFGKPVICSIADGTEKRLVRNNYNGYYFKNGDLKDLSDKIGTLLRRQELIKEFGKNSLKIIREEVNVYTVLNGYIRAFNYVTENKFNLEKIGPK